jgi:sulfate transport system substrate-binding protein
VNSVPTRVPIGPLLALVLAACSGGASPSGSGGASAAGGTVELLHVSNDPTRELFAELNPLFAARHLERTGTRVEIAMSHGGSGRQARSVIDGLEADVVSLALSHDVDALGREAHLLDPAWSGRLPDGSVPWYSTIVFVVRRGNPRGLRGWADLARSDVTIVTPNPRTSGGARWTYLAAWGWAMRQPGATEASATEYLRGLYGRTPVLDSGARGSSTTFAQNGIGDVLLTWENEAHLLLAERHEDGLEIVVPSESILAEPPVAWLDANVARHGTAAVAEAYLRFFWEDEAQEVAARHHYRPRSAAVSARHRGELPEITLFTLAEVAGSWDAAHARHFAEGGLFDQLTVR